MTQTTSRRIVGVFFWMILFCVIGTVLGVIVHFGLGAVMMLVHSIPLYHISYGYAIYGCRCGSILGCIIGLVSGVGAVKIATQNMKICALLLVGVGVVSGVMIEVGYVVIEHLANMMRYPRLYLTDYILPAIVAGVLLGFAVGIVSLALLKKTRGAWSILGVPSPDETMPETQGNKEMQAMGQQPPQAMGEPPVVVVQNVRFDRHPVQITCPNCSQLVQSSVEYKVGTATWLIGCFVCICAFCIDACKDAVHVCPSCNHMLGRKNLL